MKRQLFLLFAICFLNSFAATVYTDKIEIVNGSLPHLVYSRNKGVHAIDAVYESADGQYFTISFKVPSVKVVAFDPMAGKVTGKVIPAAGTRIAEPPMPYAFGLNYWEDFGQPNQYIKPLGWECANARDSVIKLDLSRYMETGEFTFTYPLWYPLDDCPAIFSVDISDYNWDRE